MNSDSECAVNNHETTLFAIPLRRVDEVWHEEARRFLQSERCSGVSGSSMDTLSASVSSSSSSDVSCSGVAVCLLNKNSPAAAETMIARTVTPKIVRARARLFLSELILSDARDLPLPGRPGSKN